MFIGREKELKKLNEMYTSNRLEVAVIYGRRRVGKTTLIKKFIKDKKAIFFSALESSRELNLISFSKAIGSLDDGEGDINFSYLDFENALVRVSRLSKEEKIVLVIDEYPYLAKVEPAISSMLQHYMDHVWKETNLMVILCGSSMSFMEEQVLGHQSPLYGRRTGQFKILPFDYYDTAKWFPHKSLEEVALIYGATGGIPLYIEQFSPHNTFKENILTRICNENSMLFEEPSNLLKQELREPAQYNAIITAIASGKTKLSEIAGTVQMSTGQLNSYMGNLESLGIIKKEMPVNQQNSKRPIYVVQDLFFKFWYTFIPKNMASIVSGRIEESYDTLIGSRLNDYMGLVFEKMCRDYLLYHERKLPFLMQHIGQWWGGNPKTKKQAQIDIVVTSAEDDEAIVGSCKFRNERVGIYELDLLKEYSEAMGTYDVNHYYFFSKVGYTDEFKKCKSDRIRLYELEDLYT